MQRTAEIQELYAFNRWANARIRGVVALVSDEEFGRDLKSSYPSLRDTWLHIMGAEWIWLARWLGTSPIARPVEWLSYTRGEIEIEWGAVETAQRTFIEQLTDVDLDRMVTYRTLSGDEYTNPLWQLLRHVVNHSSYHRGQITTMLRQLGHDAVSTDLVLYFRQGILAQPA
jgi:uncharacterized damage-inducible protein DinB